MNQRIEVLNVFKGYNKDIRWGVIGVVPVFLLLTFNLFNSFVTEVSTTKTSPLVSI